MLGELRLSFQVRYDYPMGVEAEKDEDVARSAGGTQNARIPTKDKRDAGRFERGPGMYEYLQCKPRC